MVLQNKHYRTIWLNEDSSGDVCVLDQRELPFSIKILTLRNLEDAASAIENMAVRGAPQIGATAAFAFIWQPEKGRKMFPSLILYLLFQIDLLLPDPPQ